VGEYEEHIVVAVNLRGGQSSGTGVEVDPLTDRADRGPCYNSFADFLLLSDLVLSSEPLE